MSSSAIVIIIIAALFLLPYTVLLYFLRPWTRALMAGHKISIYKLVGMKLQHASPDLIVDAYIKAHRTGIDVSWDQLETHSIAGGNLRKVADALIKLHARDIPVSFEIVAKTDLAGFDLESIDPEHFREAMQKQHSEPGV